VDFPILSMCWRPRTHGFCKVATKGQHAECHHSNFQRYGTLKDGHTLVSSICLVCLHILYFIGHSDV
jgi:hypothetical protein